MFRRRVHNAVDHLMVETLSAVAEYQEQPQLTGSKSGKMKRWSSGKNASCPDAKIITSAEKRRVNRETKFLGAEIRHLRI